MRQLKPLPALTHRFSHYELIIQPYLASVTAQPRVQDGDSWLWYDRAARACRWAGRSSETTAGAKLIVCCWTYL